MQRNENQHLKDSGPEQESRQNRRTGPETSGLHEVLYYTPPDGGRRLQDNPLQEGEQCRELARLRRENQSLNLEILHLERQMQMILDIVRSEPQLEELYLRQLQTRTETRQKCIDPGQKMG